MKTYYSDPSRRPQNHFIDKLVLGTICFIVGAIAALYVGYEVINHMIEPIPREQVEVQR